MFLLICVLENLLQVDLPSILLTDQQYSLSTSPWRTTFSSEKNIWCPSWSLV